MDSPITLHLAVVPQVAVVLPAVLVVNQAAHVKAVVAVLDGIMVVVVQALAVLALLLFLT